MTLKRKQSISQDLEVKIESILEDLHKLVKEEAEASVHQLNKKIETAIEKASNELKQTVQESKEQ